MSKFIIIHDGEEIKYLNNIGVDFGADNIAYAESIPAAEQRDGYTARLVWTDDDGPHYVYTEIVGRERREIAYQTEKIIQWREETLTCDEANLLWQRYQAEGSEVAAELTALIAEAKASIRSRYPDEPEETE